MEMKERESLRMEKVNYCISTNEDMTSNTLRIGTYSNSIPKPPKTNDAPQVRRFRRLPYLLPGMEIHRFNYNPKPRFTWMTQSFPRTIAYEIVVGAEGNLYIEIDEER